MLWRRRKAIVLIQLLRVYSKQNLSQQEYSFEINQKNELLVQYDEREAVIIVDHINKVKIEEFIAWFLACPKFIDFEVLLSFLLPSSSLIPVSFVLTTEIMVSQDFEVEIVVLSVSSCTVL